MKILFVQKEGGIFGAENYQLSIIPSLKQRGIIVDFLRLYTNYQGGKGGEFIVRLKKAGIKTFEINIGRFLRPWNLSKINRIIVDGHYDIVHTHLIHADYHLALVKLLLNRKLKLVSTKHGYDNAFTAKHGFDSTKQRLTPYYLISKWAEAAMNKSFTITKALRDFFISTGLTTAAKMDLIYYGFDLAAPNTEWRSNDYRVFGKQLIIAGRLVKFKGHRFVIQALKEVVDTYPDTGLVIAGTGTEENDLKALVQDLKLNNSVRFIGYSDAVQRWMFNSDIVLVPSVSEGFGVVLLEAFSCMKPVVAFDVPACNELIEDSVDGVLVKPYDIAELSKKIKMLLEDSDMRRRLGENASQKQKTFFTLERMTDQTISFYNNVDK